MTAQSRYRPDLDNHWGDELRQGEHCFSTAEDGRVKWMRFGCRRDPRITCQIAIRPQKNAVGASWAFDGNQEAPTVQPSINCEKVCGWHGFIRAGRYEPA